MFLWLSLFAQAIRNPSFAFPLAPLHFRGRPFRQFRQFRQQSQLAQGRRTQASLPLSHGMLRALSRQDFMPCWVQRLGVRSLQSRPTLLAVAKAV